ncbi:hypothetical protein AB0J82_27415 [Asanoa sp. NPDC049518]|uniref:hypothetical protein n=1 Tax=unclassified Asanoa TaxID=2685164 RepID=UPI00344A123E
MTDKPGKHLEEEPQEKRGAKGSRDAGTGKPSGDKSGRPAGTSDEHTDTSVLPQGSQDPDAPDLRRG